MSFEWDEQKRARNLVKHGVDFVDFVDVPPFFDGDVLEAADDRVDYGEIRFRCLGEIAGRVFAVSYTWRGSNRRIISARKANARETKLYHARHV